MRRLLAAALLAGAAGCYPIWSGNHLEDRIDSLENASREQRDQQDKLRHDFDGRFAAQLAKIDASVEAVKKSAHLTTAEVGNQVDELLKQVQLLRGQLSDLQFQGGDQKKKVDELEQKVSALGGDRALQRAEAQKELAAVERPKDKKAFFNLAKSYHDQKNYSYSRALFGEFIAANRYDDLAPRAQVYVGKSYEDEGDWNGAVAAFGKVREMWPKSKDVPDADLEVGLCLLKLGKTQDARAFLEEAAKYPAQTAGKQAKAKLKDLDAGKK